MTLEQLIYQWFLRSDSITSALAQFNGSPAIFHNFIPEDGQPGWEQGIKYPRIRYHLSMQSDKGRNAAGKLTIELYCSKDSDLTGELKTNVRQQFNQVFMNPGGGTSYGFAWAKSECQSNPESGVLQENLQVDVFEFSPQVTMEPDPVSAISGYIKNKCEEAVVWGWDRGEVFTSLICAPLIYCRLESAEKDIETNSVVWMKCNLVVHVLSPDINIRLKTIAAITNEMLLEGEVIMSDGSPMAIKKLQIHYNADYLSQGQIAITAHYGILKYQGKNHLITGIRMK